MFFNINENLKDLSLCGLCQSKLNMFKNLKYLFICLKIRFLCVHIKNIIVMKNDYIFQNKPKKLLRRVVVFKFL